MRLPFGTGRQRGAIRSALAGLAVALLFSGLRWRRWWRRIGRAGPASPARPAPVKVALLLPIGAGGSTQGVAKALKQAAELALFDFDNPNVLLVPKDTKGTPEGARIAAESAIHEGVELILGPLIRRRKSKPRRRSRARPVSHHRLLQRREGRRRRRLSPELPRRARRAAHRLLRRVEGKAQFRRARPAIGLWPDRRGGLRQGGVFRRWADRRQRRIPFGQFQRHARTCSASRHRRQSWRRRCGVHTGWPRGPTLARAAARFERFDQRPRSAASAPGSGIIPISAASGLWSAAGIRRPTPRAGATSRSATPRLMARRPQRIASLGYDAVSLAVSLSQGAPGERYSSAQLTRLERLRRGRRAVPSAVGRNLRARPRHPRGSRRRTASDRPGAELVRHRVVLLTARGPSFRRKPESGVSVGDSSGYRLSPVRYDEQRAGAVDSTTRPRARGSSGSTRGGRQASRRGASLCG